MSDDERFGNIYRSAIADVSDNGQLDPAAARATARQRQHRTHILAGTAVIVAVAGGLIVQSDLSNVRNPIAKPVPAATPTVTADPVMKVDPTTASPGSVVTLWFPDELIRGVAYKLEAQQPSGWRLEYYLIASTNGKDPGMRSWYRPGEPGGPGWPDIAISGSGGEKVRIPGGARAGNYRLCTADDSLPTACAQLRIT